MLAKSVLLIDDDPDIHILVKGYLKGQNFDVIYAHSVSEAIEELDLHSFNCTIIDINLDGDHSIDDIIAYLKSESNFNNPTLPIMITSANHDFASYYENLDSKEAITNFIPKPIDKEKLISAVDYSPSKKVLLIDDDTDSLCVIAGQLLNYGVEVDTAMNTQEALEKLIQFKYECVIIDIVLGKNETSKEIIDYIQHHNLSQQYHTKIIPISAFMNEEYKETMMQKTEVFDALHKPLSPEDIEHIVRGVFYHKFFNIDTLLRQMEYQETIKDPDEYKDQEPDKDKEENELTTEEMLAKLSAGESDLESAPELSEVKEEEDEFNPEDALAKLNEKTPELDALNDFPAESRPMSLDIPILKPGDDDKNFQGDTEPAFDFENQNDRPELIDPESPPKSKPKANDPFRQVRLVCDKLKGKKISDRKVLADLIAVLNNRNSKGRTPLMLAASMGEVQLMLELIETGATISLVCPKGKTALHYAARTGQIDSCKVLLGAGASISYQDNNHAEPLYDAIMGDHPEIVRFLLNKGARLKAKVRGKNYLMIATIKGNVEIFETLLSYGADLHEKSFDGITAIDIAKQRKQKEILQFIITKLT